MGRPRRMPAKEPVIAAVSLCVVAVLSGCSASASSSGASSSADPPAPTTMHSAVPSAAHSASHSDGATSAFTVAGTRPVVPSGSQDTHAQTPDASCDNSTFATDKALGARVAHGFALAGVAAIVDLLAADQLGAARDGVRTDADMQAYQWAFAPPAEHGQRDRASAAAALGSAMRSAAWLHGQT